MADHAAVTVEEDGIRVEKSFSRDEFPVPAVTFRLVSNRADPTRVRIVDTIPESFPMNQVGFHPDYESENWTAYEDHRVEYERVLEPDEDVLTVFGIRDENPDVDAFLTPPLVEHVPEDEEIEDILGGDNAEPVREVLAGESDSLPGMDEPIVDSEVGAGAGDPGDSATDVDADAESEETVAEGPSDDAVAAAIGDVDEADGLSSEGDSLSGTDGGLGTTGTASDEDDVDVETGSIDLADPTAEEAVAEGTDEPTGVEAKSDDEPSVAGGSGSDDESPEPRTPDTDSTAAVSVHEDDADANADVAPEPEPDPAAASTESAVEATDGEPAVEAVEAESAGDSEELELEDPAETDSSASESASPASPATPAGGVESVASALADEIRSGEVDDEDLEVLQSELDFETPESVDVRIGRLQSRVEDLSAYTEALEEFIDEEGTAEQVLDEVQAELEAVRETVAELDEELDAAADERASIVEDVSTNDAAISEVDEAVEAVENDVDELRSTLDDLSENLATTSEELSDTSDQVAAVEGRVDSFDEELGDVWEDVAELDARLTDVEETAEAVSGLQSEIERIDEELADLREFRDSLSDAFGG
ncbi:hypothetical protein [Haloparvum sp. PAK95]|uniref:hypothetical protein n=1 Tax=Haloparvum sp. PAK95 TaxID=3418962 RepID=UPI003D2EA8B0